MDELAGLRRHSEHLIATEDGLPCPQAAWKLSPVVEKHLGPGYNSFLRQVLDTKIPKLP